jgi:uncharacterized protein
MGTVMPGDSANKDARERIARKGGKARAKDSESLSEAGRKGGEAVVEKYGHEHMAEIGRKGGEARAQDKGSLGKAGRKGGEI